MIKRCSETELKETVYNSKERRSNPGIAKIAYRLSKHAFYAR